MLPTFQLGSVSLPSYTIMLFLAIVAGGWIGSLQAVRYGIDRAPDRASGSSRREPTPTSEHGQDSVALLVQSVRERMQEALEQPTE